MFESVLIANRGEIACRVIRACRELGIRTVAVYSEADRQAPHVELADESYLLGPAAAGESYLDIAKILDAAREADVDAVHPGYGFLSENADFARAAAESGRTFIGPPAAAIEAMGDKLSARALADKAGVAVVPGTRSPVTTGAEALAFGAEHGYPVAVKAMFGGGGRGLKVVATADEMATALESAQREATASFGRGECYLERYLERPRHIEVQILADTDGTVTHLGTRDCSLQRRHQKLIEEAPAPRLAPGIRAAICDAAVRVSRAMGYVNAGTCEFLLDSDGTTFYFLEMNTRLQVEHPVTEMVTGIDLVHAQLRIAAGEGLGLSQDSVQPRGHAIEARINAEDPHRGFVPTPGTITTLEPVLGPWVRFDAAARAGYEIPPYYDSLIGKLVVWGPDRDTAVARLRSALAELVITGIPTTIPFHLFALDHPQFLAIDHSTISVEREWDLSQMPDHDQPEREDPPMHPAETDSLSVRDVELTIGGRTTYVTVYGTAKPTAATAKLSRSRRARAGHDGAVGGDGPELVAPMPGTIVEFAVCEGESVSTGDLICVLEAMKMENHIVAHRDGVVTMNHQPGDAVEKGATLALIEN